MRAWAMTLIPVTRRSISRMLATLERNRVRDGEILIRTVKNGKPVKLPVHPELRAALDVVPHPLGAAGQACPYFLWSGNGSRRAWISDVSRTMRG